MQHVIEEFVEDTNAALTREEVFVLYREALRNFGFDSAVYTLVTDHPSAKQKAGHGIQCNFPDDWMKHYWSKNYEKIDPVTQAVMAGATAFTWEQLVQSPTLSKQQHIVLQESREAGLNNGVGVPLYGAAGEIAGVGLASVDSSKIHIDRNILSRLQLITQQFHLTYCALGGQEFCQVRGAGLTRREVEILKWWACGKTADEIAQILTCSKPTIKFHVKNIYTKLEANTKILAVTKAIRLGLIPLDCFKAP